MHNQDRENTIPLNSLCLNVKNNKKNWVGNMGQMLKTPAKQIEELSAMSRTCHRRGEPTLVRCPLISTYAPWYWVPALTHSVHTRTHAHTQLK